MKAAQTRVYRNGVLESEGFPVAEISEFLAQPDTVVWVDFCGPSKEQLDELADAVEARSESPADNTLLIAVPVAAALVSVADGAG